MFKAHIWETWLYAMSVCTDFSDAEAANSIESICLMFFKLAVVSFCCISLLQQDKLYAKTSSKFMQEFLFF